MFKILTLIITKKYLKTILVIAILSLIVFFYMVNNYLWLRQSLEYPLFFYYAFDFLTVIEIYNHFTHFDINKIINKLHSDHNMNLYSLNAALISFFFGKSSLVINMFNNIPYFILAIVSIYLIGQMILDRKTGLLAALIFSFYPAVFGISRLYVVEFAVMGTAAFSIWCLLKTEEFSNRKFSLLLGITVGWGMLVKYSFLGFFIGPLIYVLARALNPSIKTYNNIKYLARVLNIVYSASLCILIIGIHYFNLEIIKKYLLRPFCQSSEPWYEFTSLKISLLGIIEQQLSLFFFIVFILGFFLIFTKSERRIKAVILLWIFIPWVTFILMPHDRRTHYIIPYLPALALVSAIGLMKFLNRRRILRISLISLIIIVGIVQYYAFSFGIGLNLSNYKVNIKGKGIRYYTISEEICSPPGKGKAYERIISSISNLVSKTSNRVLIMPDAFYYTDPHIWRCIAWFEDLPFKVTVLTENFDFITRVLDELNQADFILYSGLRDIRNPTCLVRILERVRRNDAEHFSQFDQIMSFDGFLEKDFHSFKAQFQKAIANFELVEEIIQTEDGVNVYLYKKI